MFNLKAMPEVIYFEVTNYCNLKCRMCPHGHELIENKGFMDINIYKKVIDEIGEYKDYFPKIGFHMNGEPLLHKDIVAFVSYASSKGYYTFFHTNGLLLNVDICDDLLNAKISEISFSFEGEDKKFYELMRVNSDYNEVKKNIQYLLSKKTNCKVIIEVLKFRKLDSSLDISENFKKLFLGANFTSYYASDWRGTIKEDLLSEENVKRKLPGICKTPFKVLSISWNGLVHPCCIDYNDEAIIGDIKKDSFREVWFGQNRMVILNKISEKKYGDILICKNCGSPYMTDIKERNIEELEITWKK